MRQPFPEYRCRIQYRICPDLDRELSGGSFGHYLHPAGRGLETDGKAMGAACAGGCCGAQVRTRTLGGKLSRVVFAADFPAAESGGANRGVQPKSAARPAKIEIITFVFLLIHFKIFSV